MRRTRGFTLVELMITVAMVGILAAGASSAIRHTRLLGLGELQHERAQLLLEYHASCAARGAPTDPATVERLLAALPDAVVSEQPGTGTTTLTVAWRAPRGGAAQQTLTVFTPGGAP